MKDKTPSETASIEAQTKYVKCGELAKAIGLAPSTVRSYGAQGIFPRVGVKLPLYPLAECVRIFEAGQPQPLTKG